MTKRYLPGVRVRDLDRLGYTDSKPGNDQPLNWPTIFAVQAELVRAVEKHGRDRTPLDPARDDGTNLAVLVEEVGEVARAMTYDEGDREHLRAELIQVAAMAAAWAQALASDSPA